MKFVSEIARLVHNIHEELTGSRRTRNHELDDQQAQAIAQLRAAIDQRQIAQLAEVDAAYQQTIDGILNIIANNRAIIAGLPANTARILAQSTTFKDAVLEIGYAVDPIIGAPIIASDFRVLPGLLADPELITLFQDYPIPFPLEIAGSNITLYPATYAVAEFRRHKRTAALEAIIGSTMDYLIRDSENNCLVDLLLPIACPAWLIKLYRNFEPNEVAIEDGLRQLLLNRRILPDLAVALTHNDVAKLQIILEVNPPLLTNISLIATEGANLLIQATKQRKREVVTLLLQKQYCVDLTLVDDHGRTAQNYATEWGDLEILALFNRVAGDPKCPMIPANLTDRITIYSPNAYLFADFITLTRAAQPVAAAHAAVAPQAPHPALPNAAEARGSRLRLR